MNIKNNISSYFLILVGFLFTFGYLTKNETIKGLAFMSAASPLPLVFSSFRGIEAFASTFKVEYEFNGETKVLEISPKVYEQLAGPYNRRNAYGAAIAGAPALNGPKERILITQIHKFGLCGGALLKGFNIKGKPRNFKIIIESQTRGNPAKWEFEVNCDS